MMMITWLSAHCRRRLHCSMWWWCGGGYCCFDDNDDDRGGCGVMRIARIIIPHVLYNSSLHCCFERVRKKITGRQTSLFRREVSSQAKTRRKKIVGCVYHKYCILLYALVIQHEILRGAQHITNEINESALYKGSNKKNIVMLVMNAAEKMDWFVVIYIYFFSCLRIQLL